MTSTPEGVPHALLHNLKHNKVLHERVILLTVRILDEPFVEVDSRYKLEDLGRGFFRVVLKYGFMQEPDVPAALKQVTQCGAEFKMLDRKGVVKGTGVSVRVKLGGRRIIKKKNEKRAK